jgi:Flp pilus assembly protein TadD
METTTLAELMEEGKRHYMAGDFVGATQALRQATELDPKNAEAWRVLGFAFKENGDGPNAMGAFNSALECKPDDADAHFGLGLVYDEKGDQKVAIGHLDEALRIRPNHGQAKSALVKSLLKQGNMHMLNSEKAKAEATYERAYTIQGNTAETVVPYVERLVETGQFKRAYDVVEAARKQNPTDPRLKELSAEIASDPRLERARREHGLGL